MKPDTEIILGIRSVGAKSSEPIIESIDAKEAIKRIAHFVLESTMAQRFQIVLTRTREDALVGLGLSATNKQAKQAERAKELSDFVDSLFEIGDAQQGVSDSNEQTDRDADTINTIDKIGGE